MNHAKLKATYIKNIAIAKFSMDSKEVMFKEINKCGVIILNRPKVLNSLNYNMVQLIYPQLMKWKTDKNITHVILEGSGEKAFCAGGDIREQATKSLNEVCMFFRDEYKLNHLIGTYAKPYISLINGIVMGGGFGLSAHGKYRVATEKTLFAMPETAIGFFPDVGGSYFLPRLTGNIGMYLGLVGHKLKGKDVLSVGMATHFVNSNKINQLREDLFEVSNISEIDNILAKYHESDDKREFSLSPVLNLINEHFSKGSVEEIIHHLSEKAKTSNSSTEKLWCENNIDIFRKMSPVSLKVTFRQINEGRKMSFSDCFKMEYRIASMFKRNNDFHEGVRALIIDKDNKPQWKPPKIEEVTDEIVDQYFKHLPDDLVL